MKKPGLLSLLQNLKARTELAPDDGTIGLEVMDLLLNYINDPHIREAVEDIPFVEVHNASGNTSREKLS